MMDFASNQGANRSNSELLRGFATKSRRERRIFMSQEECNTTLAYPDGVSRFQNLGCHFCEVAITVVIGER